MTPARLSLAGAIALSTWLMSATGAAETTERTVLGWTSSHHAVVHVVERGQRMVDGASKDYYVEATEVFQPDGTVALFHHGEPVGPVPDRYTSAGTAEAGAEVRSALQPDADATTNAGGTHRFAWYAQERIDKPDERTFVCKLRYRIALLDQTTKRVYTVATGEQPGESSRRQDEALCPSLRASPHWSADGKVGFVLVDTGKEFTSVFATTDALEELPWAAFSPAPPLAATLTAGAEGAAWRAIDLGDFDTAKTQFEAAAVAGGGALAAAMKGEKRATKAVDAAYKASGKSPRDTVLRAAGYVAAGQGAKVAKWIDEAVKNAKSYAELLDFASIFELVDPNIANQLAVHALSHETAAQADTVPGWTLLAQGLLDVGEYSKAEEALSKVENPTPPVLAALAVLHLDRRQTKLANNYAEDLLFQNPGNCQGYLVQGRIRSMSGDNNAARALFEAAISCDPGLEEAAFLAADFARLAGDTARAKAGFDHYLRVAPLRGADHIRALRRDVAEQWSKKLGRDGVLVTDVSCRKGGSGFLCTGTLKNATDAEATEIGVEVRVNGKVVGKSTVASMAPGAMAPFGVSFEAKSLKKAVVTAGRDKKERAANEVDAR